MSHDKIQRFKCCQCDKRLKAPIGSVGKQFTCPQCQKKQAVPSFVELPVELRPDQGFAFETSGPPISIGLNENAGSRAALPAKYADNLPGAVLKVEEHLRAIGENKNARHFAELRASLDHPDLHVVIFGEFNRGKSTLINALLGQIVLPAKLIPTTGHVTQISYGARNEVRVRMVGGSTETCGLDGLDSFSSLNHDSLARDDIELIEVVVNCPSLREGLVLVDTPGVNDKEAQTRRAVHAIARADLVLMVLDARQLLSSSERGLVMDWLRKELGKPVVLVVNFMNFLADSDHRDIRRRLDLSCKGELRPGLGRSWYEANALAALKHALGMGPPPADHFDVLRTALTSCSGQTRRDLQRRSRRGQLLAEVRATRQQNLGVLQRIRGDAAKEKRGRAAQLHDLQEIRRRLNADARVQRERLCLVGQQALDENLASLVSGRFHGRTKAKLEANASRWYQNKLDQAIRAIEKQADGAMLALAGGNLRRPEPFTIRERMILNAPIAIGDLPMLSATGKNIGVGAVVGGIIGTFVLPGAGTFFGASVGVWAARVLGQKEADYVAAYSDHAGQSWAAHTREILNVLQGQYDARLALLKLQLDDRLEAVKALPLLMELRQRESLEAALSDCERELNSL